MLQYKKNRTGFFLLALAFAAGLPAQAQQGTVPASPVAGNSVKQVELKVTGVIKDAANGKPLAAINISVPDFSAALTDDNGRFTIKVPDYEATLFVSGQGFQSKEIALKGRITVTATLYEENFTSIYDVVQLPFGAKPRNQTVNAISSVNLPGNWYRSTETPDGILQGKAAGLTPVMRSGTPNVGAWLTLRGYNSLHGTNQPLMVVDGMIYDITDYGRSLIGNHYSNALAQIDVRDIENITVVKDGLSTYGTRAANGVILITTNHAHELATRIDAAVYGGMNFVPANLPVMKASDYRVYLSDVLKTRGWTDAQIQAQPYMNDDPSNPYYYQYHNQTNWQNEVLKNSAISNYYLKVTGGDDIARYALSMGYTKNAGITDNTNLTKYSVRFNSDLNLSQKLTAGTNLSFTYYEQNLKDQGLSPKTNPLFVALAKAPFLLKNDVDSKGLVSPNLADTDTFGVSNPVAITKNALDNSKDYRFFGSLNLKYQVNRYFTLQTLAGITVDEVREQTFIPRKGVANDTLSNAVADSRMGSQSRRIFSLFSDTWLSYTRIFNRVHKLQARAGLRYLNSRSEQDYALGYNSATDDFITVGTGVNALRKVGGGIGQYGWINNYISADYSLNNKYFATFNLAVDGSSRFGDKMDPTANISGADINLSLPHAFHLAGNTFAVMPSMGFSWLISSEDFMKDIKTIDMLKLRATFSRTGNDDIGDYAAQQLYSSQNLLGMQGLVRANISNPSLMWETVNKSNIGLDASLFNERLSLSLDVYKSRTSNMLTFESTPAASGFSYALTNNGGMQTTGIDVSVGGRLINTKSLKWDLGLVIAAYKNRITMLPGGSAINGFGGAAIISQVDAPANMFYGYKTNGVFATDAEAAAAHVYKKLSNGAIVPFKGGDVRFLDLNKDSLIDENDRAPIGNPNPDFTGAISSQLSWKRFSVNVLFTFSKGNQVYNGVRAALESEAGAYNQLQSVVNRWRAPGQITNVPKAAWGDPMGNSSFSDRWIEDGSFLRMKMISLNYNIPLKASYKVKYITLYLTGNNLLTFTKYLGYDPEFQAAESVFARGVDVGLEPQYKSVIAGVRMGL